MSSNLFVTATEARSGKSVICLGVMEMLLRKTEKVGFFRPVIHGGDPKKKDNDIDLISSYFHLDIPYEQMFGCTLAEAKDLFSAGKESDLIDKIMQKYNQLENIFDFVLCEGTDFVDLSAVIEFDVNALISKNLGCPVLLVSNAYNKTPQDTLKSIELALDSFRDHGCNTIATIINRLDGDDSTELVQRLSTWVADDQHLIYTIPNIESLGNPTVGEIKDMLGAQVLYGEDQLNRHVHNFTVAAMQLHNFLTRIEHGSLIITPGDRADVIVACLAAVSSLSMNNIAGIVLTGGLKPGEPIARLIEGFSTKIPILIVTENTYPTATIVDKVHATLRPQNQRKITQALATFEKNVNVSDLAQKVITSKTSIITPKMFEYGLLQKARSNKKHIVLTEGEEERILRATEILLRREVVDITLLGNPQLIKTKIAQLGLRMESIQISEPCVSTALDDYAHTYYEMRKHKGVSMDQARDLMCDVQHFGTMMVRKGQAHGMVSGAVHTTRDTIRPSFEIICVKPGFSIVSSVFLMCMGNRVLVYGDCAVNPNPNAQRLAEIAVGSALTAKTFGIEPIVAMLSYSSGDSGIGAEVEKVRQATNIAKELSKEILPGLKLDGPIQYDAAIDPDVAKTKMPESEVAGRATVFIFPDLNTGNNTYKAVQRNGGVVAIGPILQGLNKPVNDLSRGCTVTDIVNTVAITSIQAQME